MNSNGKLRAQLATARLPNTPSVISNVWLGIALGAWHWGWESDTHLIIRGCTLAVAALLLYLGGNFLNDWYDREWDARHRPERAIPMGLIAPLTYQLRAIRFLGLGIIIACFVNFACAITAAFIVANILIYTFWHKKAAWPVIPMGLCRALLIVMGFLAIEPNQIIEEGIYAMRRVGSVQSITSFWENHQYLPLLLLHATGLFVWIVGLSLTARYESMKEPPLAQRSISYGLLILAPICIGAWWMRWYPLPTLLGATPVLLVALYALWRKPPVPKLVGSLLAAIPLVDLAAALPLASSRILPGTRLWESPILSITVILPGLAYMLGRRLQRWVPAT